VQTIMRKYGKLPAKGMALLPSQIQVFRHVEDGFLDSSRCRNLIAAIVLASRRTLCVGHRTSIRFPDSDAREKIGNSAWIYLAEIVKSSRELVEGIFHANIELHGGTLSRLVNKLPLSDCHQIDSNASHSDIELDGESITDPFRARFKATIFLNSHYEIDQENGFEGGRVVFADDDANRILIPRQGRILAIRSCAENLHFSEKVSEPFAEKLISEGSPSLEGSPGISEDSREISRRASFRIDMWFREKAAQT